MSKQHHRAVVRFMKEQIRQEAEMRYVSGGCLYYDHRTCEVNYTRLAEAAAHHFDHDEWLDDSDHWIWEAPIEAAQACKADGLEVLL